MRFLRIVTAISLLSIFGIGYANAHVVRLTLIDHSDFQDIGGNVYLSKSLLEGANKKISSLLQSARQRISVQYGNPVALPTTVVLGNKTEKEQFGLDEPPGKFLFAPWGSYLLLDFEQANIDVIAHELIHAEIVSRIGYIKRQLSIPTWFDEGAAMQVDYRQKYVPLDTIDQAGFARLVTLDKPGKFWSGNRKQELKNYRKSKAAVAELFVSANIDLYALLDQIKQGEANAIAVAVNKTSKALQRPRH